MARLQALFPSVVCLALYRNIWVKLWRVIFLRGSTLQPPQRNGDGTRVSRVVDACASCEWMNHADPFKTADEHGERCLMPLSPIQNKVFETWHRHG
ncbi:hypothetical protein PSP6_80304 [Paraburkholderia tropica]|uniref:hypothetical protein n=1 Tax=Paraburkholderia tropica TaxID=92647 RepID=UPI001CAD4C74|nr:hypothetical protein [Paraburkholderia tropica]CAG9239196.1 hypothetical protein PSP6_80304 [Paraburkholderia tropica]